MPKLLLHAQPGVILPEKMVLWCRENLSNLTAVNIGERVHYLQEDHPEEIGQALAQWLRKLDR